MSFESYAYEGAKRLRRGFTTGTCASLAAKAAATELLGEMPVEHAALVVPGGERIEVPVVRTEAGACAATCAAECVSYGVHKDAGDDPDVTDGLLICACVSLADEGISIDGGRGVGRVTMPGLDQPVGNAAINSVPRAMIADALSEVADEFGYSGGFAVVVEVPGGEEVAERTFNPRLGIEGGISILGTSGIVEPRSLEALKDALEVEMRVCAATGSSRLIITPGNLGERFIAASRISQNVPVVQCANFIGFALDRAAIEGFSDVLLVGHVGKLVKVAGSVMDTHSQVADCRREIFAAHAALAGAEQPVVSRLFDAVTSEACLDVLDEAGLLDEVVASIARCLQDNVERRSAGAYRVGTMMFSSVRGELSASESAEQLLVEWKRADGQGTAGQAAGQAAAEEREDGKA